MSKTEMTSWTQTERTDGVQFLLPGSIRKSAICGVVVGFCPIFILPVRPELEIENSEAEKRRAQSLGSTRTISAELLAHS